MISIFLKDERVTGVPLEAVAKLLDEPPVQLERREKKEDIDKPLIIMDLLDAPIQENEPVSEDRDWAEAVLNVAAPLLERTAPPPSLARVLARLASQHPRSPIVQALRPAITRCLKHTVDFGKSPDMRRLLQVFVAALYENDDGEEVLRQFIASVHGPSSDCPHPRVLPNLVSICVAAIFHRLVSH